MSETIKIIGGKPLYGEVTPVPNKNAILAALPACVLTDEIVTYKNLPKTTDVIKYIDILKKLGAEIDDTDFSCVKICCKNINSYEVDYDLGSTIRASILLVGPLLVRFGKARIPMPGGCVLGKRSIGSHIDVFSKVGVKISFLDNYVEFEKPKKINSSYDIWMIEAAVTATENIMMYSAGIKSKVKITGAASEPHVTQLLHMLSDMGSSVSGFESNVPIVEGVDGISNIKGATFEAEPDFVDIGGLIVATAVTHGKITLLNSNIPRVVDGMVTHFEKFNIKIERKDKDLIIDGSNEIYVDPIESGFPLAGINLPKLSPRPWPGFPADVLPVMVTLACKNRGSILIQNWMYETGLDFISILNSLGANIFMADPQRVIVNGPTVFKGGKVTSPSIIQACKAIFLAGLCDSTQTIIEGADILKRRYPDVINVYKNLGADIELIS